MAETGLGITRARATGSSFPSHAFPREGFPGCVHGGRCSTARLRQPRVARAKFEQLLEGNLSLAKRPASPAKLPCFFNNTFNTFKHLRRPHQRKAG